MAGYADELSLKLTAKDEMSARLKGVQKELQAVTREMATTSKELKETGSPEAAAKLRDLEREFQRLAKAQQDAAKASKVARDALKKIQSEAGRATTAMGRLGQSITKHATAIRNAGLIAGAAMLLFAKQSISAFADAEKQQAMLSQAYGRFPKLNDVTRKSFDDLNTSIMNLTGTDDDALAAAEGMLARFDLTGTQIQQLIPLVNDYAILMGKDVVDASSSIGKALLGNARALKDMGINFKATGDRGKDLATIMELLQEKAGGAGKAFGAGTAGQLAIANQNFENLKESVGEALVPALQGLVAVVRSLVGFFTGLSDPTKRLVMGLGALSAVVMIATPRIIAMKAAMVTAGIAGGSLRTGVRNAGSMIAGIGGPITIGLAALALWIKGNEDARAAAESLAGTFDTVNGAATALTRQQLGAEFLRNFSAGDLAQTPFTLREIVDASLAGADAQHALALRVGEYTRTALLANPAQLVWLSSLESSVDAANRDGQAATELAAATTIAGKSAGVAGQAVEDATPPIEDFGAAAWVASVRVTMLQKALSRLTSASSRIQALRAYRKAIKDYVAEPSADAALSAVDSFNTATDTFKDGSAKQARFIASNYATMKRTIATSGLSAAAKEQLLAPLRLAREEAQRILDTLNLLSGKVVPVSVVVSQLGAAAPFVVPRAAGGAVFGPGTGTSDSIPAMLSNGEFVIRQAAAKVVGYDVLERLNRADRVPVLPALVHAPRITLPAQSSGRDAPLVGQLNVYPTGQIDVELALAREARRQERDRRTRYAGAIR